MKQRIAIEPISSPPTASANQQEGSGLLRIPETKDGKLNFKGWFNAKKSENTLGTRDDFLASCLVYQSCGISGSNTENPGALNATLAAVHGIGPRNTLEGLLAVQMVGMHNLALKFMAMSLIPANLERPKSCASLVEQASKCSRMFTAQIEALNRLRGKGNQRVVVEHVTVNQGGQAVVGQVHATGGQRTGGSG